MKELNFVMTLNLPIFTDDLIIVSQKETVWFDRKETVYFNTFGTDISECTIEKVIKHLETANVNIDTIKINFRIEPEVFKYASTLINMNK